MQTAATLPPAGGTALAQPQPLPPLRDELKIHPAGNNRDGSPAWHLADPVRNLYFRLGWLEMEILSRWNRNGSVLAAGEQLDYTLAAGRLAYVHLVRGSLKLNGQSMTAGDGAKIATESDLHFMATDEAEILLFDLPPAH